MSQQGAAVDAIRENRGVVGELNEIARVTLSAMKKQVQPEMRPPKSKASRRT
jgi:hypothetical protein